jgi:hypothetical protein
VPELLTMAVQMSVCMVLWVALCGVLMIVLMNRRD